MEPNHVTDSNRGHYQIVKDQVLGSPLKALALKWEAPNVITNRPGVNGLQCPPAKILSRDPAGPEKALKNQGNLPPWPIPWGAKIGLDAFDFEAARTEMCGVQAGRFTDSRAGFPFSLMVLR